MPSKKKETPVAIGKQKAFEIVGPPGCEVDWGINYRPVGKTTYVRAEIGSIVTDLPAEFRDYLLGLGYIVPVETK